jgi:8-oxo-dGTP pyrophosphatase MutT (NUDIX family)
MTQVTRSNQPANQPGGGFTVDEFRELARSRLLPKPSDQLFDPRTGRALARSDWDLTPQLAADLAAMEPPQAAAVLVPVVARNEPTILLTQRTDTLARHAGQISFPGGRIDAGDADATAAALRETYEEIGISRSFIEPLGFLDSYRTGTGYLITPVVALVMPGFTLTLEPGEVAEVFEVPMRFLMSEANHLQQEREWRGRRRAYWAMPYGERYIWGATAGMLKNLYDRVFAPCDAQRVPP